MPVVTCSSQLEYLSRGREKERNHGKAIEIDLLLRKEISMNPSSANCEAKHRYKCVVWEARGKKNLRCHFTGHSPRLAIYRIADYNDNKATSG